MQEAWIIDAVRTPRAVGKIGKGAFSDTHPQRLLSAVLAALSERNSLNVAEIDEVIAGCNNQLGRQAYCIARASLLDAGWDPIVPGMTVQRFCGSGLSAVNSAAMGVMSGVQSLVVAGGVESMSHVSTHQLYPLVDAGNAHLRDLHPQPHQGICADVIATIEGIARDDVDALAMESQRRAAEAIREGRFSRGVIPVYDYDGTLILDHEEFPRPGTTLEGLATLAPAFAGRYDAHLTDDGVTFRQLVEKTFPGMVVNHVHHAGNSSGVVDGAGAIVVASSDYARSRGLKPRARIRAMATVGDSPELMLNAPVPAARKVLQNAGMSVGDVDLFEVNEAFAAVPIKFMRDLDVDPAKVNVNGGAIALGHPIGATGAMLIGTLVDELERRDLNTGLVTMCTGGGMAPAMIIERI
ncbi:acetyl-CoA C-acetyltransferase [Sphingobium cloacae]|uniref:Acetyl-CoA acetyltransferase n=1 Tax=Sphingobium cloacae TaxID=120107 RepID=A0A1E1EY03_9SPHN|nr:acetyl-CoA C-acetyltransferase [Sphingobium cloacae]BAV63111.1 acetyl-CoA acetyltransferase [Sphingobium cloacae]